MDAAIAEFPFWRIGALANSLVPGLLIVLMLLRAGRRTFSPALLVTSIASGVAIAVLPLMLSGLEPAVRARLDPLAFFLVRAFGFAGLSEEAAKLVACWFIVRPRLHRSSRVDMVLGCAGVGLGFALIENVSYVLNASDAWKSVALIRAVSAVPMHAFVGLVMGYGLSMADAEASISRRLAKVTATLAVCAALHGLYDLPMFLGEMLPLTLPPVEALANLLAMTTPTLLAATHVAAVVMTAFAGLVALSVCRADPAASSDAERTVKLTPAALDGIVFAPLTGVVLGGALLLLAGAAFAIAMVAVAAGAIRSFPLFVAGFGVFLGAVGWGIGGNDLARARWRHFATDVSTATRLPAKLILAVALGGSLGLAYWGAFGLRYAVALVLVTSGVALNGVGATDRALGNFNAALEWAPGLIYAYSARADVFRVRQDYDLALADLDRAVAAHPDDASARAARAVIHMTRHDYERALPDFDRALTFEPDNAAIIAARGGARIETGDIPGAERDADAALKLKPDFSPAHELRARILTERNDVAGAIAEYGLAIITDSKNTEAHFARGRLHFENRNFAAAGEDFWRAAATGNRSYAMLWLFLARGHLGQDGRQELETFGQATAHEAWPFLLAELYLGTKPLASVAAMAATNDQQCEVAFYFGELQLLGGREDDAFRYLARAKELCPHDFVEARMARKDLERLEASRKVDGVKASSPPVPQPAESKRRKTDSFAPATRKR